MAKYATATLLALSSLFLIGCASGGGGGSGGAAGFASAYAPIARVIPTPAPAPAPTPPAQAVPDVVPDPVPPAIPDIYSMTPMQENQAGLKVLIAGISEKTYLHESNVATGITTQGTETTIGAVDPDSAKWVTNMRATSHGATLSSPTWMGMSSFQNITGAALNPADAEVQVAYQAGWTGKGVNIAQIGEFAVPTGTTANPEDVASINIMRNSSGSTLYRWTALAPSNNMTLNVLSPRHQNTATNMAVQDNTGFTSGTVRIGVMHVGINAPANWANDMAGWAASVFERASVTSFLKSNGGGLATTVLDLSNTAIIKAAGAGNSNDNPLNVVLMSNAALRERTLLVGATSGSTCGTHCDRFVVASSQSPITTQAGDPTLNASSLVASYTAILQQKFPGLAAEKYVNALLRTADANFSGYNQAQHGAGMVSLTRAMRPVGMFR